MSTKLLALLALFAGSAHAAYFPTFTINNFDEFGVYNLTLPVLADGGMSKLQLDSSGRLLTNGSSVTQPISAVSLPLPTGAALDSSLGTINTTLGSPFQAGGSIGNTTFTVTQGTGTNLHTVVDNFPATQAISAVSLPLPTGAATDTKQDTGNTSLSSIDGKVGKTPINTTGSGSAAAATVTTVAMLTAPANAVGFILMNLDTSTTNMRWAVGRVADVDLGQQLQPGRDTGFVPVGANVSIIAESGTVNYDIQWVSQ
jgi:hypothetical protein